MCFFSVGRVCSDPLLLGSEANWVGWLGLVGDGRAGWVGLDWLGPSPGFLPLCGECGGEREETVGGGVGTVRYMCILFVF